MSSLLSAFDRLYDIGNIFPDTIFNNVTHLAVYDEVLLNHEFFVQVTRSFIRLTNLYLSNLTLQSSSNGNQTYSIIQYPSLMSLNVT